MIDDFALGLTQLLILVTIWRMLHRGDLDVDLAGGAGVPVNGAAPAVSAPAVSAALAPATAAPGLVPSLFGPSPYAPAPYAPATQGERQP